MHCFLSTMATPLFLIWTTALVPGFVGANSKTYDFAGTFEIFELRDKHEVSYPPPPCYASLWGENCVLTGSLQIRAYTGQSASTDPNVEDYDVQLSVANVIRGEMVVTTASTGNEDSSKADNLKIHKLSGPQSWSVSKAVDDYEGLLRKLLEESTFIELITSYTGTQDLLIDGNEGRLYLHKVA